MDKRLENFLLKSKLVSCEICGSRLYYLGAGRYECKECNEIFLDDYGKIREFLDQNGPSPAIVISKATGVDKQLIEGMLSKGKLEIPENSKYYIKCERCGGSLRYGSICPLCAKELTNEMKNIQLEDVGEPPKHENRNSMKGKMHFLGRMK